MNLKNFCQAFFLFSSSVALAQPNWPAIKANTTFIVADTNYYAPQIQVNKVGAWEDGLYITRDGKQLFSTYLPIDALSWIGDISPCINFRPYYRGPLVGIDTLTNPFGCGNYMQSDVVMSLRSDTSNNFSAWQSSNLQHSVTFDGAACGVKQGTDSFDVFVFTTDSGPMHVDIMFMSQVSNNPNYSDAVPILQTAGNEDNPHIERLSNAELLLIFDRDRYMYYSTSSDNGITWQTPTLITSVLNDQAPYDVQPHLWNDGNEWWVYFCADNAVGKRCIYRSKQVNANDWNSWSPKELVIEPNMVSGGLANVLAIGEPSLTAWGDLSFVVVYGNTTLSDSTDVFDCDPWIMKRKQPITTGFTALELQQSMFYFESAQATLCFESKGNKYADLKLYDLSGALVLHENIRAKERATFSVEYLASGLYLAELSGEKEKKLIKILKQ
jgi:hypothetical protein